MLKVTGHSVKTAAGVLRLRPRMDPARVVAFLRSTLTGGAVTVADLEVRARAAGLLGERQRVTDAKTFKAAKKKLSVTSRRDGFGRGGEWSWALPAGFSTAPAETAVDITPKVPASVIYADHSRPDDRDRLPDHGAGDGLQGDPVLLVWIRGVARLDLGRVPRDVPPHRWQRLVNDCQHFMTSSENWAARAAEMGWDTASLFGCCATRPLDHLQGAGLLWRLAGGKIVGMYSDWAVITVNGKEQVIHRRPTPTNFVLPWGVRAS
jgi:hypothetical protein